MPFTDLLAANQVFADLHTHEGFDGVAHAGVAMVTCMDSRILPLEMIGLGFGDAKIIRTPGGHVTNSALRGLILGVHLLGVERILIVPHTRCAMAQGSDRDIIDRIHALSGLDASDLPFGATTDQLSRLKSDVDRVRTHPLIEGRCEVGGFIYDVDSGRLEQRL